MEMAGIDPERERKEVLKKGNIFKRIKLAIKKKKKKPLQLVDEAVENMVKIKQDELVKYKELEGKSDELQEEDLISKIEEDIKKDDKQIERR